MRLSGWLFWYSVKQQLTIRCVTRVEPFRRHPKDFERMLFGFFGDAFPLITLCRHVGLPKCPAVAGRSVKPEADVFVRCTPTERHRRSQAISFRSLCPLCLITIV